MAAPTVSPWTDALEQPYHGADAITPSDANNFGYVSRGIYVGVTGDVSVLMGSNQTAVVFKAVPAGTILPVCAQRVNATGTTATNLLALY